MTTRSLLLIDHSSAASMTVVAAAFRLSISVARHARLVYEGEVTSCIDPQW
jgi:hypothetical protein